MASVTAENASAMQVTLGTTVTAQQTSARAGAKMARSAATVGTACVGSANAQSQEPLGRHVRSAQPAQMPAAPRGNGPHPQVWNTLRPFFPPHSSFAPQTKPSSSQSALRAASLSLPYCTLPALLGSETLPNIN